MTATPEEQMAKLATLVRVQAGIESVVSRCRRLPPDELTTGQFTAQILLSIYDSGAALVAMPTEPGGSV